METMKSLKQKEQLLGYNMDKENKEEVVYDPIENPDYYTAGFEIEPLTFIMGNELDFAEGNVVKYISRYQNKGGLKDLEKARFYINKIIDREKTRNEFKPFPPKK